MGIGELRGTGAGGGGGGGGITVLADGGHPPTPSASTVGRIYEDPLLPGHVWIGIRERISRVAPSLTANDFTHANYEGAHASNPPGELRALLLQHAQQRLEGIQDHR